MSGTAQWSPALLDERFPRLVTRFAESGYALPLELNAARKLEQRRLLGGLCIAVESFGGVAGVLSGGLPYAVMGPGRVELLAWVLRFECDGERPGWFFVWLPPDEREGLRMCPITGLADAVESITAWLGLGGVVRQGRVAALRRLAGAMVGFGLCTDLRRQAGLPPRLLVWKDDVPQGAARRVVQVTAELAVEEDDESVRWFYRWSPGKGGADGERDLAAVACAVGEELYRAGLPA